MEIADTFAFVLGTWAVHRSITDHRSGERGSFVGTASLEGVAEAGCGGLRARYREAGTLRLGRHRGPAERRLVYVRSGSSVLVRFEDGHRFVELDLSAGGASHAVHDCRDDRYDIWTAALSPDLVEERWQVRGPAKDWDALTVLERRPAGSESLPWRRGRP